MMNYKKPDPKKLLEDWEKATQAEADKAMQAKVQRQGSKVDLEVDKLLKAISVNSELIHELYSALSGSKPTKAREEIEKPRAIRIIAEILSGASELIERNNRLIGDLLSEIRGQLGSIKLWENRSDYE
jgi:hypothetical protein